MYSNHTLSVVCWCLTANRFNLWNSVSYVVHVAWQCAEIRYPYNPTILQSFIYVYVHIQRSFCGEILRSSYQVLFLYFLCGTRKEVRMEIRFPVKFITSHELLAKNMGSLVQDSNKIGKHMQVIKNECQVWVELYHIRSSNARLLSS